MKTIPLDDWLAQRAHVLIWECTLPNGIVQAYMVCAQVVIVQRYKQRHGQEPGEAGWDVYTACRTNSVADTLADLEARLEASRG